MDKKIIINIPFFSKKLPFLTKKTNANIKNYYLFDVLKIFQKKEKKPVIKENTFLIWEPCSKSHAEVVPGFAKYLLEMGYHTSILISPERYKEGLFERFNNDNISFNILSQKEIKSFFKSSDLKNIKGVLVTTVGKLCDSINYNNSYEFFNKNADKSKIFFVEHEVKASIDAGKWKNDLITLRKIDYKDAKSVVINPHYFGQTENREKNKIVNFITIGALNAKRKNSNLIIDAVSQIVNEGYSDFKITVVGKGDLKGIPSDIRKYFDIKGRLDFSKMYKEIEKADYILTSYDENDKRHLRYITTGTSGNFQLVYGFNKPCIILSKFAQINGFSELNAVLYSSNSDYKNALIEGIKLSQEQYSKLKENLKKYSFDLYKSSLENFKNLIEKGME